MIPSSTVRGSCVLRVPGQDEADAVRPLSLSPFGRDRVTWSVDHSVSIELKELFMLLIVKQFSKFYQRMMLTRKKVKFMTFNMSTRSCWHLSCFCCVSNLYSGVVFKLSLKLPLTSLRWRVIAMPTLICISCLRIAGPIFKLSVKEMPWA